MVNRQTVHHSWSLFQRNKDAHPADAYGDEFRYDECLRTPGLVSALFVGFSICLFAVALLISPVRLFDNESRVFEWANSSSTDTFDFKTGIAPIWHGS